MLPATRVIGHKEYGNVGHPGRKSDPVYDMNWRRVRVANFRPRAGAAGPSVTAPPLEAEMLHQIHLTNPTGDTPDQSFLITIDPVGDSLVLPKGAQAFLQWAAFFPPAPGAGAVATEKARLDWLVYRKKQGDVPVAGRDVKHRDRSGVSPLPVGTREIEGRVLGIPKGGVFTVQVSAIGRAV